MGKGWPVLLGLAFWIAVSVSTVSRAQTLGEALNATNLTWTTGGNAPWVAETIVTHDGEAAASTGTLAAGQTNWIQTSVAGPTAVNFWWKVSTGGSAYGKLNLFIGGTLQTNVTGEVDWQQRNFYVPPGTQVLQWAFALNYTASTAQNMAWVDQVSLAAPSPPAILIGPTNQTASAGNTVAFDVSASGTERFAFQWQLAGTNLPGATQATFSITNCQAWNTGDYAVAITNVWGAITSQVATLTVTPSLPFFTFEPVPQGAALGATVSFQSAALGSAGLAWQWYFESNAVAGGTSAQLTISNVRTSNFGHYWAVVTNAYGSATSAVATLSFSPVICWGRNDLGQTVVPPSATNVVALAAGDRHLVGLRGDGNVLAWGSSNWFGYYDLTDVPPDATNVVGIAAGSAHSLAVRSDGVVVLWGHILGSPLDFLVPPEVTNVAAQAQGPGAQHALSLLTDGTIREWGNTNFGLPNVPPGTTNIVGIAAGALYSVALRADGTVVAWGYNSSGQTVVPKSATNVVAISSGWYHNLALRADGTMVQWPASSMPVSATNIVAFACGGNNSLALRVDGKLFAWGDNTYGQTALPTWATNLATVAGGSYNSLALVADGPAMVTSPLVIRSVLIGGKAFFRATAVGAAPLSYQWQFNHTNLPMATNALLVISNAQPSQAGSYAVVVTNALGVSSSPGALLTVVPTRPLILTSSLAVSGSQITFLSTSSTGLVWAVEGSTNLLDWTDLAMLTNSTGTMVFSGAVPNSRQGFYRLRFVR